MELVEEKVGRGEIKEVPMVFDPLTVWVVSGVKLVVEPGDRLGDVAKAVRPHLPGFYQRDARKLVAYWFALGERIARGNEEEGSFTKKELRANPKRRYSPKTR